MSKALVTYFSASGTTAKLAKRLADAIGADTFEIEPAEKYSAADLDWTDTNSRSYVEHDDRSILPAIKGTPDTAAYDVVFVGFPVWWYREPNIIDTFVKEADLAGKTVVPFATSGMSPIGDSGKNMQAYAPDAKVEAGKRFSAGESEGKLKKWAEAYL